MHDIILCVNKIFSRLTGVHQNKVRSFFLAYLYLGAVAAFVLYFELSLYASTVLYMLAPAAYIAFKLHREGRYILEAVLFSIPAILTVDLVGHLSHSWDYWRSEILGIYIGPYPLIGFFWGFSFWLAIVVFYEYFYDGSHTRKAPQSERWLAFAISVLALLFILFYDGQTVQYFYVWVIAVGIVLSAVIVRRYRYPFWKTYLPVLGLLPASLLYEYVSLELGHWVFDPASNIFYLPFFGHALPVEEILWFLVIQHWVIVFHESFADNHKF